MWKYFTHKNTKVYLKVLPKLVNRYNHIVHSSIKMKPKDVTIHNQNIVLDTVYSQNNHLLPKSHMKFKVGDDVRIGKMKHMFAEGCQGNFSYAIFTVVKVISRNPPVFKIKDYEGQFYSEELQKVKKETATGKLKRY